MLKILTIILDILCITIYSTSFWVEKDSTSKYIAVFDALMIIALLVLLISDILK